MLALRILPWLLAFVTVGAVVGSAVLSPRGLSARLDRAPVAAVAGAPAAAEALPAQPPEPLLPTPTPPAEPASADQPAAPVIFPTFVPTLVPAVAPPAEPSIPAWAGSRRLNLLLVGLDKRPDEQIGRTDTILLARVDLDGHTAGILSIPRDLVVDIPGYGYDRINTAYVYGELHQPGSGIETLRRTVLRNFKVPVDHYAVVDFACFRGLVDAAGGVEVDVPKHIVDTAYPTDDYGYERVEFLPGLQLLDGTRALEYARTRHADNDFGRMRRQQQVILALRQQLLRPRTLASMPSIVRACWGTSSDLSFSDMASLGWTARDIAPQNVSTVTLDADVVQETILRSGADVLLPRWDLIQQRVARVFPTITASAAGG